MGKKHKRNKRAAEEMAALTEKVNAQKAAKRQAILDGYAERATNAAPGSLVTTKKRIVHKPKSQIAATGERHINKGGYWVLPSGTLEHRSVYYKHYGKIPSGYVVHHIDQCKTNNAIENLIAMPEKLHNKLHDHMRRIKQVYDREQTIAFCKNGGPVRRLVRVSGSKEKYQKELEAARHEMEILTIKIAKLEKLLED